MSEHVVTERWWVIYEANLLRAFNKVAAGQSPDVVMLELLANSDTEDISGD